MESNSIRQGLRVLTSEELRHIQQVVKRFPKLNFTELVRTLCEHLEWYSPSGALKVKNCRMLLRKLADQGQISLPPIRPVIKSPDKAPVLTEATKARPIISGSLKDHAPITLKNISEKADIQLWNEFVERYHPLGHRRPFGNWLKYFCCSGDSRLGCLLISGAAKTLLHRDQWIDWSTEQRRRNLSWVINNSRYLIFPWVQIPNLASHVLGQLVRRVAEDWQLRWHYRPVLLETFVDPQRYLGTCYKAAGWNELGMTQGEGHFRPGKQYQTRAKIIFVKPLTNSFRILLCSERLKGNLIT